MKCTKKKKGVCTVIESISKVPFKPDNTICQECIKSPFPRNVNPVTVGCSVAISNEYKSYLPILNWPKRRVKGNVGTRLKEIIPNCLTSSGCGCKDYASKMDSWGISGCEKLYDNIIERLVSKSPLPERPSRYQAKRWLNKAIKLEKKELEQILPNNDDWFVGVTTAPRKESYLHYCLSSIIESGWTPTLFAEPGSNTGGMDLPIYQNEKKLGVWFNWLNLVETALNTNAKYILSIQDDVLFHPESRSFIEEVIWPSENTGFVSLYTAKHYSFFSRTQNRFAEDNLRPTGVRRLHTKSFWGAVAMVFPREVLERAIETPTFKNWMGVGARTKSYRKTLMEKRKADPSMIQNSDTAIGKVMNKLGLEMYIVDPSPVKHIAKVSSISHGGNTGKRNCYRCADPTIPLREQVYGKHSNSST
jgi:hypothetical protein